jgi:carbon-monoxide dehydrogenase large subunit/6-hydroxypseudooxynicotine dehydrogenase subunit gamma
VRSAPETNRQAGQRHVGARTLRLEDSRLLRGEGRFVDDLDLPGQLHVRMIRSTIAHGILVGIDTAAALGVPGVVAIITAADLGGMGPLQTRWQIADVDVSGFLQPVLAAGRVRYVGEPVAAVVAVDPYVAEDAAELVLVEIDPLPPVVDARLGLCERASRLRVEGNEAALIEKAWGDVDSAFGSAAHTVALELSTGRQAAVPMETRGCLADYDPGRDRLWVWGPLNPSAHRRPLATLLGLPESSVHVAQGDIGGNFGARAGVYPEHVVVPFLARLLRRPVKWVEDRPEHLVATSHAREQWHRIEAAFDEDGILLALRDEIWHDIGAYVRPQGVITTDVTVGLLWAPYRVPAYRGTIHAVTTNKTPICPYRGPGRFEGSFVRERLLDVAAKRLGIDPVEIRRRNLLTPKELPFTPGIDVMSEPLRLADMDVPGALETAVEVADLDGWRREAVGLRRDGRLVGNGVAISVDKSGLGRYETGAIEIDGMGRVRVTTGGFSVGQGVETVLAQIASDELGVAPRSIEVRYGDTERDPHGVGSFSGRTTVLGGSAVLLAARETAERARTVAAELLEANAADILLEDGRAHVAGSPQRYVGLDAIARACDPMSSATRGHEPGLGARTIYVSDHMNHPYGVTFAQVEIDAATCHIRVRRLFVVAEVGRAVNPMLVEGQLVGAAAQGLGAALLEELRYDDLGQPLTTTFMDYLVPTASEVPVIETLILEDVPATDNPLGVKGAGETGGIGVGAAIANAIEDALGTTGAITRLPVAPQVIHRLLRGTASHAASRSPEEGH